MPGSFFVLAHRGGCHGPGAGAPARENTVEAFRLARLAGADGVELDVRRAADGELVVVHDAALPGWGPVHATPGDRLPTWVPSLAAALDACGDAVVDIEIKNAPTEEGFDPDQTVAGDVVSLLAERAARADLWHAGDGRAPEGRDGGGRDGGGRDGGGRDGGGRDGGGRDGGGRPPRQHWLVTSFWPDTLQAVAAAAAAATAAERRDGTAGGLAAHLDLGLLVHPSLDAAELLDRAAGLGCAVLLPHCSRTDSGLVRRATEAGLAVVAWTAGDAAEVRAAAGAGALGVVADDVAAAVRVRDGGPRHAGRHHGS